MRAKFRNNLPPKSLGANVRVVCFRRKKERLMVDVVPFEYLGVGVGMGCIYLLDLSKK